MIDWSRSGPALEVADSLVGLAGPAQEVTSQTTGPARPDPLRLDPPQARP